MSDNLSPITREELFLAKAAGMNVQTPTPITRIEKSLDRIGKTGGNADLSEVYNRLDRLSKAIGELDVQPDWNQNDETEKDYIKNRPFWTDDPAEVEMFSHVFENYENFLDYIGLKSGEIYTVTASKNGVEQVYACQCVEVDGVCALGNLSMNGMGENTREPFLVIDDSLYNESVWMLATTGLTITIHGMAQKIHPISSEFLPQASDTNRGVVSYGEVKGLVTSNNGINIYAGQTTFGELNEHLARVALPIIYCDFPEIGGKSIQFLVNQFSYHGSGTSGNEVMELHLVGVDFVYGYTGTINIVFPLNVDNWVDDDSVVTSLSCSAQKTIMLESSTTGSTKRFNITVDDSGTITATEVTQ